MRSCGLSLWRTSRTVTAFDFLRVAGYPQRPPTPLTRFYFNFQSPASVRRKINPAGRLDAGPKATVSREGRASDTLMQHATAAQSKTRHARCPALALHWHL